MNLRDTASRVARTFFQAFIGVFLALTATAGIDQVPDLETLKRAGLAALFAGFVAAASMIQNMLENATGYGILGRPVSDTRAIK